MALVGNCFWGIWASASPPLFRLCSTWIHGRHFPPQKGWLCLHFCVVIWACYDDLGFVSLIMSRRWEGLEDSLLSNSNDGSCYLARLRAKKGRCLTYCIMPSA